MSTMLTDQAAPTQLTITESLRAGTVHSAAPVVTVWAYGAVCPPGFKSPGGGLGTQWLVRRPWDELLPILRNLARSETLYQVLPGQTQLVGHSLFSSPLRTNILVLRALGIPVDAPTHDLRIAKYETDRVMLRAFVDGLCRDLDAALSEEANRVAAKARLAEWLQQ